MARRDISATAKVVLLAMNMESWGKGGFMDSDQLLAKRAGVGRSSVLAARQALVEKKLIEADGEPEHQVQAYRFLHPEMQAKTGGGREAEPVTVRDPVRCGKCCRACRGVGKAGMCRACVAELELPRQVQAALDRLGAGATAQDIAAHLRLKPLAAKIERILRRKAAVA